jgi:hypothetical protein
VDLVLQASAAQAASTGFPVDNPFDGSSLKDPRNFFYGTSAEQISVLLYGWVLSEEFDHLDKQLAKFVDEDNPLAGEAGFGDDGLAIITAATAATGAGKRRAAGSLDHASISKQTKVAGEANDRIVAALEAGTSQMCSLLQSLQQPHAGSAPSAPLSAQVERLTRKLATETATYQLLSARHHTLMNDVLLTAQTMALMPASAHAIYQTRMDNANAELADLDPQLRAANGAMAAITCELALLQHGPSAD